MSTPEMKLVVGCEQTTTYVNSRLMDRITDLYRLQLHAALGGNVIGNKNMTDLLVMLDETKLEHQPCDYVGEVAGVRVSGMFCWTCPACEGANSINLDHLRGDENVDQR